MRVCIIIPNFYPAVVYGGWVFSSINTCRELAALGISSYVSTTNDNGGSALPANSNSFLKVEENIFVKYYPQTIKEKLSISMLFKLWRDILPCDIVHIQGIFSAPIPIGLFYAYLANKKVLMSPHGCLGEWCLADGSRFKKLYLKFLIAPHARRITWHATAEQEKKEILALYPKAHIEIIPNGINMEDFGKINKITRTEFAEKYAGIKKAAAQILICMSRLHKKKGLDILIQSFYKIIQKFPEALLFIAGEDFGEKNKLVQLIRELDLGNSIFFVGHLKDQDRIDFFANADIFVLPSHNENFGLVYAEAMAAGTPVVASKNTPWKEVDTLNIGKWVENDPGITATAVEELLKEDLGNLGAKAKLFVQNNYSWKSIGVKFQMLFEKMQKSI